MATLAALDLLSIVSMNREQLKYCLPIRYIHLIMINLIGSLTSHGQVCYVDLSLCRAMYGHRGSVDHVAFNGELAISGGSDW